MKRENAARFTVVQSNVAGRDLVSFVTDAQAAVAAQVKLPPGYSIPGVASSRTSSVSRNA